jgi:aspartyl-tRNA(Asn)/glutamyl-tRNA(Gln) amidotransferase subunit A
VADLALLFAAMADQRRDPPALHGSSLRGQRFGVPASYFNERIEPAVRTACDAAQSALQAEGAQLIEVALPPMHRVVPDAFTFSKVEASYLHRDRFAAHPQNVGADARAFLQASQGVPALAYVEAQKRREVFRAGVEALFDAIDVLVAPTLPASPKPFGTDSVFIDGAPEPLFDCMIRYTSVFNVSGHPALAAPCPIEGDGLPAGIQLVGPFGGEDRLLRLAAAYAQAALGDQMTRLATLRQRAG